MDPKPSRTTTTAAARAPATSTTEANPQQRRRPRKLNRPSASSGTAPATTIQGTPAAATTTASKPKDVSKAVPTPATTSTPPLDAAATAELEALKARVRGLEQKVENLYKANEGLRSAAGKSPRRRGKGRRGSGKSGAGAGAGAGKGLEDKDDGIEEAEEVQAEAGVKEVEEIVDEGADEELVRLEGELQVARRDLETYQSRRPGRSKIVADGDEEDFIEEIPRGRGQEQYDAGNRQVTLTGSYRIPLPSSISMRDVKSIQEGIASAQNVAKCFLDQRRAGQQAQSQTQSPSPSQTRPTKQAAAAADPLRETSSNERQTQVHLRRTQSASTGGNLQVDTDSKQSWGEWFGGYSMAISRAVKSIETQAAVESQPVRERSKPGFASGSSGTAKTTTSAASSARKSVSAAAKTGGKSAGGAGSGNATKGSSRTKGRGVQRGLSGGQIDMLMG